MFIYNITTKVAAGIHSSWISWMQEVHIPEVMATGFFISYRILRILEIDDSEGPTYAIQYECKALSDYHLYIAQESERLKKSVFDKWGNQTIAFRSFMEIVN